MTPEEIHYYVNAAAPLVVAFVLIGALARWFWKQLPWHPKLSTLATAGGVIIVLAVVSTLAEESPKGFLIGWVALGLPVYVVRRHLASADARAAHEQRLRQARGHERRRAAPPLPSGHNQHPGGTP